MHWPRSAVQPAYVGVLRVTQGQAPVRVGGQVKGGCARCPVNSAAPNLERPRLRGSLMLVDKAALRLSQPLQHLCFSALCRRQKHQPSKLWLALWTTSHRCPFQDDGMPRRELSVLQAQPESSRKPQQSTKMSKLLFMLHWACLGYPTVQKPQERRVAGKVACQPCTLEDTHTLFSPVQSSREPNVFQVQRLSLRCNSEGTPLWHSAALCAPTAAASEARRSKTAVVSTRAAPATAVIEGVLRALHVRWWPRTGTSAK